MPVQSEKRPSLARHPHGHRGARDPDPGGGAHRAALHGLGGAPRRHRPGDQPRRRNGGPDGGAHRRAPAAVAAHPLRSAAPGRGPIRTRPRSRPTSSGRRSRSRRCCGARCAFSRRASGGPTSASRSPRTGAGACRPSSWRESRQPAMGHRGPARLAASRDHSRPDDRTHGSALRRERGDRGPEAPRPLAHRGNDGGRAVPVGDRRARARPDGSGEADRRRRRLSPLRHRRASSPSTRAQTGPRPRTSSGKAKVLFGPPAQIAAAAFRSRSPSRPGSSTSGGTVELENVVVEAGEGGASLRLTGTGTHPHRRSAPLPQARRPPRSTPIAFSSAANAQDFLSSLSLYVSPATAHAGRPRPRHRTASPSLRRNWRMSDCRRRSDRGRVEVERIEFTAPGETRISLSGGLGWAAEGGVSGAHHGRVRRVRPLRALPRPAGLERAGAQPPGRHSLRGRRRRGARPAGAPPSATFA